jgi:hypothetical protein
MFHPKKQELLVTTYDPSVNHEDELPFRPSIILALGFRSRAKV